MSCPRLEGLSQRDFLETLPHSESQVGVYCEFSRSMAVTTQGDALGFHVKTNGRVQIVKQGLNSKACLFFSFKHRKYVSSLRVFERLNLVLSGGVDKKLVTHSLNSGKTLQVLSVGLVSCIFGVSEFAFSSEDSHLRLVSLKCDKSPQTLQLIKTDCSQVECMQVVPALNDQTESTLLLGGHRHLTGLNLPEDISRLVHLENTNFSFLRVQNQKLEQQNYRLTKELHQAQAKILDLTQTQRNSQTLISDLTRKLTHLQKVSLYC